MYAAISMTRQREIQTMESIQEPLLKRSQRIGSVQYAVPLKINSSRCECKADPLPQSAGVFSVKGSHQACQIPMRVGSPCLDVATVTENASHVD